MDQPNTRHRYTGSVTSRCGPKPVGIRDLPGCRSARRRTGIHATGRLWIRIDEPSQGGLTPRFHRKDKFLQAARTPSFVIIIPWAAGPTRPVGVGYFARARVGNRRRLHWKVHSMSSLQPYIDWEANRPSPTSRTTTWRRTQQMRLKRSGTSRSIGTGIKTMTLEQLDDALRLDVISGDTQVWRDMADWQPLSVVAGMDGGASADASDRTGGRRGRGRRRRR